jgi:hypothetical protein
MEAAAEEARRPSHSTMGRVERERERERETVIVE